MLDVSTRNVDPTIHAQAWRVEFVEDPAAPADGVETIEIAEPRKVTAALAPLDASVAFAQAEPETAGGLTVVWLPSGSRRRRRSSGRRTNGFAPAAHGEERRTSGRTSAPFGCCGARTGP